MSWTQHNYLPIQSPPENWKHNKINSKLPIPPKRINFLKSKLQLESDLDNCNPRVTTMEGYSCLIVQPKREKTQATTWCERWRLPEERVLTVISMRWNGGAEGWPHRTTTSSSYIAAKTFVLKGLAAATLLWGREKAALSFLICKGN